MEITRSHQSAHGASRLAQLFTRYPIVVGFILMFALTWPLDLGLAAQWRGATDRINRRQAALYGILLRIQSLGLRRSLG